MDTEPKIISVRERSTCSIPLNELVGPDGTFKYLDIARNRGFVEIRQGEHSLELKVGGIVGRMPVTPALVLDISPKFPIANLARMIAISDTPLSKVAPIDRLYQVAPNQGFFPEAVLKAFAASLGRLIEEGLHKEYVFVQKEDILRPRLNFNRSQKVFWSRGKPFSAVVDTFEFTTNTEINRLIKAAAVRALAMCRPFNRLEPERRVFAEVLALLSRVDEVQLVELSTDPISQLQRVPSFRTAYRRVAPLAYEILKRSTVLHELTNRGMVMQSYLLVLDKIFESYVRNCLAAEGKKADPIIAVRNGNKPLFDGIKIYPAQPDLLFFTGDKTPLLVGDLKYKIKPEESDRYQVISYAFSYRAKQAVLIYPSPDANHRGLRRLGELGPDTHRVGVYEYYFDLAGDMIQEEASMFATLSSLTLGVPAAAQPG